MLAMMTEDMAPPFFGYNLVVFITMSPKSIQQPRVYRSELRQQQAQATRSRVVAAAAQLFTTDGYARTTLAKIAAAAGVSAETVQAHGPKAALLIAAVEYAGLGVSGEESIFDLDIGRKLLASDDREETLDLIVAFATETHERSAHLGLALIGGASTDPELDRHLNDLIASINLQIRRVLDVCRDRGWLRVDIPFDEIVETGAVLCSVDTYLRMTHHDGWSVKAYRGWLRRMLAETVFSSPQAT
ncbi:TetR/AcrR family transcriptional regulator [Mycobacterium sp. IS-1264]|uniref:TetR/AcrR family transcriptional regulator n=1 Tax=Mycobacterium sp. IS-1264 TaxID=1834158 RepID=UPI0011156C74|nr:TetR/AcrR family transcriptional regulator [Mycobacterium sp. IS-1264]